MPLGLDLLLVMGTLVIFGATKKLLKNMQVPRWLVLVFIAAALIGSFIAPIQLTDNFLFSIGGALVPLAFCTYLFITIRGSRRKVWTLCAAVLTAVGIFVLNRLVIQETDIAFIEPMYFSAFFAALVANILCKNIKSVLTCAISGTLFSGLIGFFEEGITGGYAYLGWGSFFEFDCIMIAAFGSMLIARAMMLAQSIVQRRAAKKHAAAMLQAQAQMQQSQPVDKAGG